MRSRRASQDRTADFVVVGGGIIGVATALELTSAFPGASVALLEKEADCGVHASGRNSGVLHAGFYYTSDSLKARFTRDGNKELTDYCRARGLSLNACGKVVVARTAEDLAGLDTLIARGRANGVEVHEITAREALELEPQARTHERALWSPTTSTCDPIQVLRSLVADAESRRVSVLRGVRYLRRRGDGSVDTTDGRISAGYFVNAAGLQADHIARDFGFGRHLRVLPFKGLYLYGSGRLSLRRHVYPVPNLDNPFLGVHFTLTVDNHVKIGPTAIPAFWREHYGGLANFKLGEFSEILWREAELFVRNDFSFRRLAAEELRKYGRRHLLRLASALVPAADPDDFTRWGTPGIRAQLFNLRTRKLEMDFSHEGDDRSFHILNAVSPGFTCAFPYSRHVVGEIRRLVA